MKILRNLLLVLLLAPSFLRASGLFPDLVNPGAVASGPGLSPPDISLQVTGTVMDESGMAVPAHMVYILVDSLNMGFIITDSVLTSPAGDYYWEMSLPAPVTQGVLEVSTFDCNHMLHTQTFAFNNLNTTFTCDFIICVNGQGCQASFFFQEGNCPGCIDFFDLSSGMPVTWFWDFGDGTTSPLQNPQHQYTAPGDYPVSLFIFTADSCSSDTLIWVPVYNFPGDCQAAFYHVPDTLNSMSIFFFDVSVGNINQWEWDFGDGMVSFEPNPVHTYAAPGVYNVCLTVSNFDPIYNCFDIHCEPVEVVEPFPCQAAFTYFIDPMAPLQVSFMDNSTALLIDLWYWDFGDGTSSTEQNPVHTYASPGTYPVCLTITGNTPGLSCTDTHCENVFLEAPALTAAFEAVLDTVSGSTNRYFFHDLSSGDPMEWYWDFGDDEFSFLPNPEHQYDASGTYQVCLAVSKFWAGIMVTDTFCITLTTPNYFDLGGFAFLGDYPLNNPVPAGDTGVAYLYRVYGDRLVPDDTNTFWSFGYYWFIQKREGNYRVKVKLTSTSTHYGQYAPAYNPSSLTWQNASTFTLADSSYYTADVHLLELPPPGNGIGVIDGSVTFPGMDPLWASGEVSGIEVLLFDAGGQPLACTFSGEGGLFSFPGLPFATYGLYAEEAGYYTDQVTVLLNSSTPIVTGVELQLYQSYVGIVPLELYNDFTIRLFPNPVNDLLNITLSADEQLRLTLYIYTLTGIKAREETLDVPAGELTFVFDCSALEPGVYLLQVLSPETGSRVGGKFVKK
jgi:PKD repeat protein